MNEPYRIAIIGDGWRSRFFCRVARSIPDRLKVALVVGKHDDAMRRIQQEYQVPACSD